jgi:tripartite ATP-independent transporter DctM subunit
VTWLMAGRMGGRRERRAGAGEVVTAFARALPALVMPLIIIVGILSGAFTATEAGVVAVAYGVAYGFATRQLDLRTFFRQTMATAIVSSSILIILGGATLFSWILTREGVPAQAAAYLQGVVSSREGFLLLLVVLLFIVGIFIEPIPAMIMLVPVLLPIAGAYGVDPIHFAVILTIGVLLGSLSPPVAVLVLIACKIAGIDPRRTNRPLVPMFGALLAAHLLVAFTPQLSTWLPRVAGFGP